MTDTVFVNAVTLSDADFFNDLDRLHYTIFGDPATLTAARNTLIPSYTSAAQTITAAGSLTLAHGLGATPTLIQARLKCIDAGGEANYAQNNEFVVYLGSMSDSAADSKGVAVIPDATNLNVRFGSNATTFNALDKTTGALTGLTNTKWNIIFRAWLL